MAFDRVTESGANLGTFTTAYDDYGNAISRTRPVDSDANPGNDTVTRTYDGFGRLRNSGSATGIITERDLDLAGRVVRERVVDASGNLIRTVSHVYDDWGRLLSTSSTNDRLEPDGTTSPLPNPTRVTEFGWALRQDQQVWRVVDPNGAALVTRFGHDVLGRVVSTFSGLTDEVGESKTLDAMGRVLTQTLQRDALGTTGPVDPSVAVTQYLYDRYGFLSQRIAPDGSVTSTSPTPAGTRSRCSIRSTVSLTFPTTRRGDPIATNRSASTASCASVSQSRTSRTTSRR